MVKSGEKEAVDLAATAAKLQCEILKTASAAKCCLRKRPDAFNTGGHRGLRG